jgi:membrane protein implicated in regulation of membrane protease activity
VKGGNNMLFLGGVVVGMIISLVIVVISIIVWKKFIKKRVDDAIFKAGLKAIEAQKEKDK